MDMFEVSALSTAFAYADKGIDAPEQRIYTRVADGVNIPPSTYIRLTVELLHKPDPEVTPVLELFAGLDVTESVE